MTTYKLQKLRLYIKQHFSHPPMDQSVAIIYFTDGLNVKHYIFDLYSSVLPMY